MEAVVFDPVKRELRYVKKNLPGQPNDYEVLIKVVYSGVCGTDLHISQGEFPCKSTEVILGHEFSGVAQAVGSKVKHVQAGDKVVVNPNTGCYTCSFCTSGRYHLCQKSAINDTIGIFVNGGWAEYCLVPSTQVFKIPVGITLEQAALTEPLSCLAHGWNRIAPVKVGQRILIQGAGIIGNLWAALLHLQGHKRVVMSEPNELRRNISNKLETSYPCVDPSKLTEYKNDFQPDIVIDCSGSAQALESAVDLLAPGGKLCVFGVAPPIAQMSISPYEIYKRELTIVGVMINPYTFPQALNLIESMGARYLDYDRLGVRMFKLQDFQTALDSLKRGEIAKAVFHISKKNIHA